MMLPGMLPPLEETKLSDIEEAFVFHYARVNIVPRVAKEIGVTPETCRKWLKKPHIQEALRDERLRIRHETEVSSEFLVQKLVGIVKSDMRDVARWGMDENEVPFVHLYDSDLLTDDAAGAISEISMTQHGPKVKFESRRAATMDLAKLMGLVVEKREVNGTIKQVQFDPTKASPEVLDAYEQLLEKIANVESTDGE